MEYEQIFKKIAPDISEDFSFLLALEWQNFIKTVPKMQKETLEKILKIGVFIKDLGESQAFMMSGGAKILRDAGLQKGYEAFLKSPDNAKYLKDFLLKVKQKYERKPDFVCFYTAAAELLNIKEK